MSSRVHVVTVGAGPLPAADVDGTAVIAALASAGVPVATRAFVDEDETAFEQALAGDGGVTVVIAGAGGSVGDIVRRGLARAAAVRLALNERMLAALEDAYRRRDRAMPRRAERLALLPVGATVVPQVDGAPVWTLESPRGVAVVLPRGHAGDTGRLVMEHVLPLVRSRAAQRGGWPIRTLKAVGLSLEDVEERLIDVLGRDGDVSVVVVPADAEVWVRLRPRATSEADVGDTLARAEAEVRALLGDDCYGADGDTLEHAVASVLRARGMTLAVAESCTGGLVGHRLTNLPGSSAYFERGVVVYSNRAKMELLAVPESVLATHGAVSAPTAEAMVRGICALSGATCGLSITGIAGPDGGTPTKPVGTVFIGLSVEARVTARGFLFAGDRGAVKWQASQMALDMLRRTLGTFPGGD